MRRLESPQIKVTFVIDPKKIIRVDLIYWGNLDIELSDGYILNRVIYGGPDVNTDK